MAEQSDVPVLEGGTLQPSYKENLAGRRDPFFGTVRDIGLDVAASAIDTLSVPASYVRDAGLASGNQKAEIYGQLAQRGVINAKDMVKSGKTDYGRQEDENGGQNTGLMGNVVDAVSGSAASLVLAGMTGYAAPAVYGALAHGQAGVQAEERLRKMPQEELKETAGYKRYEAMGLDHDDIMRAIYKEMRDSPWQWANVGANVAFGGLASKVIGKIGSRSIAQSMKDRIINDVLREGGEAIGGGAITGFAQGVGRQKAEVEGGIRTDVNWGEVGKETQEMATTLGALGLAAGTYRGARGPGKPAPTTRGTTGDLLKDAGTKPIAPEIGTTERVVAIDNLKDNPVDGTTGSKPGETLTPVPAPPEVGGPGVARPPEAGVVPPPEGGAVAPPAERVTPAGKPGEAVAPPPVAAAGVEGEGGARYQREINSIDEAVHELVQERAAHDSAPAEVKATLEWREQLAKIETDLQQLATDRQQLVEAGTREAVAPPVEAAAPAPKVEAAPPVEAVAPVAAAPAAAAAPETAATKHKTAVDALTAKVSDLAQTPTHGDALKHIEAFKKEHGLKRLSEQGDVIKAWSDAKKGEKQAIEAQRQEGIKTAREKREADVVARKEAKEQADLDKGQRDEAKKQAKGYAKLAREQAIKVKEKAKKPKVTPPGKAEDAAAKEPEPVKAPEPVKPPEPAKAPEPPPEAPAPPPPDEQVNRATLRLKLGRAPEGAKVTHGAAAEPIISQMQQKRSEDAAKAWNPVRKRLTKVAKDRERAAVKGASREDKTNAREAAAKQTIEDHKPGANAAPELDRIESVIRDGKPAEVQAEIVRVAEDVKEIVADYQDRLHNLRGGRETDDTFMLGTGKPKTKKDGAVVVPKSRAGKGEHHSFMSDLYNTHHGLEAAIKKGDYLQAKELTLKYLEDSKRVREGEIGVVTEGRTARADAAHMAYRTEYAGDVDPTIKLTKAELDVMTPEAIATYEREQQRLAQEAQKTRDQEADLRARDEHADAERRADAEAEDRATAPKWSRDQALRQGDRVPLLDKKGNAVMRNGSMVWVRPQKGFDMKDRVRQGPETPIDRATVNKVLDAVHQKLRDILGDTVDVTKYQLFPHELADLAEDLGIPITRSTYGKEMKGTRPSNMVAGALWDIVYGMTKHHELIVWPREVMQAYVEQVNKPDAQWNAFYHPMTAVSVFQPHTLDKMTMFHEALHAVTSRAIDGSDRLAHLVKKLQDYVEEFYKNDQAIQNTPAYWLSIGTKDERVNQHEFISELYTVGDVRDMIENVVLTPEQIESLKLDGYDLPPPQKSTMLTPLKTLWRNVLKTVGFLPKNSSALDLATNMFHDIVRSEDAFRAIDVNEGRVMGSYFSPHEMENFAKQDPVRGRVVTQALKSGNHPQAVQALMSMAHNMDEKTMDRTLGYMRNVNEGYWRGNSLPSEVTPLSNREQIQSGVADFISNRFGSTGKNLVFQAEKKFGTSLRALTLGMKYTNDIGRNLEQAFQNVLQPLKDAWSNRENFSQKYMDETGANALIDKIATFKHATKDRPLWNDFENLLIRESYARSRADEELGVGANSHIVVGSLRDRQSVRDHAKNRELLESIKAKNPELIALRNEIFDFTAKELETRQKASVRDMLIRMDVAKPDDDVAISAFMKDIRRDNKSMTAEERTAMDRVLNVGKEGAAWKKWDAERKWIEANQNKPASAENWLPRAKGGAAEVLKRHMAQEARHLASLDTKEYKNYVKSREDVRQVLAFEHHNGPHVPFQRHGNHAVYTEFDVKPDEGVRYNEVEPTADLHKQFDFVKEEDAQNFIDNTLSHDDVNITVNNAHEVVYDKNTGAQAAHWTVEKPDRSAKTYTSLDEANAAMQKGDKITKRNTTPEDLRHMKDDGQDTSNFETRHRVVFNPKEFVKFENEREAHEYRDKLVDPIHPNVVTRVSNVETPHDMIGRANVAYTSAEMKNWIKREEQSPRYQRMDPSEKEEWSRQMRVQAARVTATAGRRTSHLPREYARGASTDILKNMIDYAGSSARAVADLTYRNEIDRGLADAEAYVGKYREQSGFNARRLEGETEAAYQARRDQGEIGFGHRARDDALREIKKRLFAEPKIDGTWALGVKRALQVSMISHLADTGYLIVNAIEPWVFGAAISASRHGWAATYGEMGSVTKMLDPMELARIAGQDIAAAAKGKFGANQYEGALLKVVAGKGNTKGDGKGLGLMFNHLFNKGLAARDVGMEVERIHDPSKNWTFRQFDRVDNVFRGFNTGVETFNRALLGAANYRLEYARALKDMGIKVDMKAIAEGKAEMPFNQKAHDQAVRFAEDMIFKAAGDYGAWNNPRYFNNPMLKLALQFKKYPLRIFSVYADAVMKAVKGDRQAQIQVAYMTLAQFIAAGGMGLPISSAGAGITNAMYILGLTDDNWDDVEFNMRKGLADRIGVTGADVVLHGALRQSGADFSPKLNQNSFLFHGSPTSRNAVDLMSTLGKVALGAPGHWGSNFLTGSQKLVEAAGHYHAGADSQATAAAATGLSGIVQIKVLSNIIKAGSMMMGGPTGLPKGTPTSVFDAASTAVGFQPTSIANKLQAKATINREKRKESEARNTWINRWRDAPNTAQQTAIWGQIQKNYNAGVDNTAQRISLDTLWKAKQRKAKDEKQDDTKLGVRVSGRQKHFSDISHYFNAQ